MGSDTGVSIILKPLIIRYSEIYGRGFANKIQTTLPSELRAMVYGHVVEHHFFRTNLSAWFSTSLSNDEFDHLTWNNDDFGHSELDEGITCSAQHEGRSDRASIAKMKGLESARVTPFR